MSDLSDLDPEDAVRRAVEIVTADSLRPYDLADGPLIRPRLIRIAEDDHRLYLGLHHLIWDGMTLNRVVFPELVPCTAATPRACRRRCRQPEAQYADYTQWELDWVRGPETAKRIERWRERLAGHHLDPAAARSPAPVASDLCRRDDPADDRSRHR